MDMDVFHFVLLLSNFFFYLGKSRSHSPLPLLPLSAQPSSSDYTRTCGGGAGGGRERRTTEEAVSRGRRRRLGAEVGGGGRERRMREAAEERRMREAAEEGWVEGSHREGSRMRTKKSLKWRRKRTVVINRSFFNHC